MAEDHQTKNARALSDKNAAVFCADKDARAQLADIAISLVNDHRKLAMLEQEVKKMAFYDSAEVIAKIVIGEAESTKPMG